MTGSPSADAWVCAPASVATILAGLEAGLEAALVRAEAERDRPPGGMRVPYHGPFVSITHGGAVHVRKALREIAWAYQDEKRPAIESVRDAVAALAVAKGSA